jgi:hypothetical protein
MEKSPDIEKKLHEKDVEEDEEVTFIFLEFVDFNKISTDEIQLSNLGTSSPQCKVGDCVFTGQHEVNLGSKLFFDGKDARVITKTEKKISFHLSEVSYDDSYLQSAKRIRKA